jgi:predicted transcriptional regulator
MKVEYELIMEIRNIFGLSQAEIAALLGVRDAVISSWLSEAVPSRYDSDIRDIHRLAVLLLTQLIPSSIPAIIRKNEPWLKGHSILDMIKAEGAEPIYIYLDRLFEYNSL